MLLDEQRVRRALSQAFPALEPQVVRYFAAGWDYELWELTDGLLARFPLRDDCAAPLPVEARLLAELASRVSVAVPTPLHYSDGVSSFPQPFFIYRKLPGAGLDRTQLNEGQIATIAQQVGAFLTELHGFPVERAAAIGVPAYSSGGWRTFYREFRAQCDERVSPLLNPDERGAVERFWSAFLDSDRHFSFTPTLVHADLGPDHILVDAGKLSGIIDFGDVRVGDPAIDIVGLRRIEASIVEGYGGMPDETFLERSHIYWQIGPFHEVLYGLDIDGQSHIDAGLAGIRARIVKPA